MKLAFSGDAHYTSFDSGYERYVKGAKTRELVDRATYNRVVRSYCQLLVDRLYEEGMVDLPCNMGTLAAVKIKRKPQFRKGRFVGFGKLDWEKGTYDDSREAFGVAFLPKHGINDNLRCYGFVANRRLYQRMRDRSEEFTCPWVPMKLTEDMI